MHSVITNPTAEIPLRSVVQVNGNVSIPTELRKFWNLGRGDLVAFLQTTSGWLLVPQTVDIQRGEIINKSIAKRKTHRNKLLAQRGDQTQPEKPHFC